MKSYGMTIQMKAIEPYFPVVLFIMLHKVVLTFESVDEILWYDHSNKTSSAVLSHGIICFVGFEKVKFRIFLKILLKPLPGVKGLKLTLFFRVRMLL